MNLYIYIYIYIYTRLQKRCNFKVYMIYICLLFSHQKGVDRKNNMGPFLQKERTIAAVKPFVGFEIINVHKTKEESEHNST